MTRAGKINLLYPPEREVYKLRRVVPVRGTPFFEVLPCKRCGSPCWGGAVQYNVRDKGSRCLNVTTEAIHTRCVPSGDAPIGMKARGRNASQVRAGKG